MNETNETPIPVSDPSPSPSGPWSSTLGLLGLFPLMYGAAATFKKHGLQYAWGDHMRLVSRIWREEAEALVGHELLKGILLAESEMFEAHGKNLDAAYPKPDREQRELWVHEVEDRVERHRELAQLAQAKSQHERQKAHASFAAKGTIDDAPTSLFLAEYCAALARMEMRCAVAYEKEAARRRGIQGPDKAEAEEPPASAPAPETPPAAAAPAEAPVESAPEPMASAPVPAPAPAACERSSGTTLEIRTEPAGDPMVVREALENLASGSPTAQAAIAEAFPAPTAAPTAGEAAAPKEDWQIASVLRDLFGALSKQPLKSPFPGETTSKTVLDAWIEKIGVSKALAESWVDADYPKRPRPKDLYRLWQLVEQNPQIPSALRQRVKEMYYLPLPEVIVGANPAGYPTLMHWVLDAKLGEVKGEIASKSQRVQRYVLERIATLLAEATEAEAAL